PVEVIAILGYASNYFPSLMDPQTHILTHMGFLWAIIVLALVIIFNFFAVRWVLTINSTITFWKLIIPVLTIIFLLSFSFHPSNLHVQSAHLSVADIFTATIGAGVAFSYFGFRVAIEMGGETAKPGRNIPIAIIGSLLIAMVIYVALQYAFILALPPDTLKSG